MKTRASKRPEVVVITGASACRSDLLGGPSPPT